MNQPSPSGFVGGRWAAALAVCLLLAVAASTLFRWLTPAGATEEIVQLPVPGVTPAPRETPTAPDPGDNP